MYYLTLIKFYVKLISFIFEFYLIFILHLDIMWILLIDEDMILLISFVNSYRIIKVIYVI